MVILKTVNSNSGIKMKNTYGDESYLKFPEYGILHYIKKIFGETELKDFLTLHSIQQATIGK